MSVDVQVDGLLVGVQFRRHVVLKRGDEVLCRAQGASIPGMVPSLIVAFVGSNPSAWTVWHENGIGRNVPPGVRSRLRLPVRDGLSATDSVTALALLPGCGRAAARFGGKQTKHSGTRTAGIGGVAG